MLGAFVAAAVACAPFAQVDQALKSIGEKVVMMGRTAQGYLVVYSTPDGETWTVVTVEEGEKTCLVSEGRGLRMAAPAKGA